MPPQMLRKILSDLSEQLSTGLTGALIRLWEKRRPYLRTRLSPINCLRLLILIKTTCYLGQSGKSLSSIRTRLISSLREPILLIGYRRRWTLTTLTLIGMTKLARMSIFSSLITLEHQHKNFSWSKIKRNQISGLTLSCFSLAF